MKRNLKAIILPIAIAGLLLSSCDIVKPSSSKEEESSSDVATSSEVVETKYNIRWIVEGEVKKEEKVKEGQVPEYGLETPTKERTVQYSYTFSAWEPAVAAATKDQDYIAKFTKETNKYTITFDTKGGSTIAPITKDYGSSIEKPSDPTKEDNEFLGWKINENDESYVTFPLKLENDLTLIATWKPIVKYTIRFLNGDTVLQTSQVKENTMPVYEGEIPTKEPTVKYNYTFISWSPEITKATKDQDYIATFTEAINKYTITFDSDGGSKIDPITEDYGTTVDAPNEPTKDGYRFLGWTKNLETKELVTFPYEITGDITLHAVYKQKVDLVKYLKSMLMGIKLNPYKYIPESMHADYKEHMVNSPSDVIQDFTTAPVNISKINQKGFNQQWMMIIENLEEGQKIFNILTVVESLTDTSVTLFETFLNNHTEDTVNHQFSKGQYTWTIDFDGKIMNYALSFKASEVDTQIWIEYNILTGERTGRIQLGDANALKYIEKADSYEFALRLAGVRRSYFKVEKAKDNTITGTISEHLGIDNKVDKQSAAQFFINDKYVSCVGNKAAGMALTDNTVLEVYDITNGHLVGFEIEETKTIQSLSATYNTLWFNLEKQRGISSVQNAKVLDSKGNESEEIRINGKDTKFTTLKFGGISLKRYSRRYDIELRKQYLSHIELDEDNKEKVVTNEYLIPMLFIQEEVYDDVVSKDIKHENDLTSFASLVSQTELSFITSEYKAKLEPFKESKDTYTVQFILDLIGEKYVPTIA